MFHHEAFFHRSWRVAEDSSLSSTTSSSSPSASALFNIRLSSASRSRNMTIFSCRLRLNGYRGMDKFIGGWAFDQILIFSSNSSHDISLVRPLVSLSTHLEGVFTALSSTEWHFDLQFGQRLTYENIFLPFYLVQPLLGNFPLTHEFIRFNQVYWGWLLRLLKQKENRLGELPWRWNVCNVRCARYKRVARVKNDLIIHMDMYDVVWYPRATSVVLWL